MIISCDQCTKKFEIESNLIPDEGRLLQCSSCSHKWFYKKILEQKTTHKAEIKKPLHKKINLKKKKIIENKVYQEKNDKIKKISLLNVTLVFIISVIALIILVDTFINPLSQIFPGIKFILNNLYETLTDIILFFKDLL